MSNVYTKNNGYQLAGGLTNDAILYNTDSRFRATTPMAFSGDHWAIWFNGKRVANVEAITLSESRESVGLYTIGNANAITVLRGKRVIVGSMSLQKWDRDSLLEEVFEVSNRAKALTVGDLWASDSLARSFTSGTSVRVQGRKGTTTVSDTVINQFSPQAEDDVMRVLNTSAVRGLTNAEATTILNDQVRELVESRRGRLLNYVDELPPFDISIVGLNDAGVMSAMSIYGIFITQKTTGITMNDLNPSEGMSFICLKYDTLRPVEKV